MSATNNDGPTVQNVGSPEELPATVAQQVDSPQSRQNYRFNASLPPQAWESMDQTIYPAFDQTLRVVQDLRSAGLTTTESIFNKYITWQKDDYDATAQVSMHPDSDGTDEAEVDLGSEGVPLPVIHSPFSVHWRDSGGEGAAPGGMGNFDFEQAKADASGRAVAEAAEDLVLNGWEPSFGDDGFTLHGLTTHPDIHTGTLSDWTTAPGEIRNDMKDGLARDLKDDEVRPGGVGYNVYIGSALEDPLAEPDPDFQDSFVSETLRQAVPSINSIQVSDYLADDAVLMFRPTPDVVDLAIGLEETVVEWNEPHTDQFQVMMGFAPRVKSTKRGQSGIAYYTGGTS